MNNKFNGYNHFVSGGLSGIITKTITSPLDRVKILFQLKSLDKSETYNIRKTYTNVIKNEGFLSLYKGNFTNCLKAIPTYGLKFGLNDYFQQSYKSKRSLKKNIFYSGLMSGFLQTTATYPLDLIRTRLVLLEKLGYRYNGIYDCFKQTIAKEGVMSIYKGYNPTIYVATLYVGMQMTFYDFYKNSIMKKKSTAFTPLIAGSLTGLTNSLIFYPSEVIKRRLQLNGINGNKKLFSSPRECISYIIKNDKRGVVGLYRGMPISLIKIIPSNGLQFYLYEYFKLQLK